MSEVIELHGWLDILFSVTRSLARGGESAARRGTLENGRDRDHREHGRAGPVAIGMVKAVPGKAVERIRAQIFLVGGDDPRRWRGWCIS